MSIWLRCAAALTLLLCLTSASSRAAQETLTPLAKVKLTLGDALAIVHDQQMPLEQRRQGLRDLADRNLDLPRMARGSLGSHWYELSQTERDEYVSLFSAFIEAAYLSQIQDYVRLNIEVTNERSTSPNYALVDAIVKQPHEDDLPITFMLERHGNDWMVYDVRVENVSMIENYRGQFDHVIKRHGLAKLLNDLRMKQKQLAALIGKP